MNQGTSCATNTGSQPELYTGGVYDGRHQLLSRSGTQSESYQYDASGNITAQAIGASQSSFLIGPGTNRLQSGTVNSLDFLYVHDPSGNRVKDTTLVSSATNTRKFFYNALGQLVGDSAYWDNGTGFQWLGSLNMFRTDARGRRVKAQSSPSIYVLYDGDNVVRAGGGAGEWRYIQGPGVDDPLVGAHLVGTWTKFYYLTDGRGRQLAFTDTAGANQQDALVYTRDGGSQAGGITASHGFQNARAGSPDAPKLSFYRHRYYDQQTGRWTQEDPIGIAGGVNLYQYVGNNPAAYTDPFGLLREDGDDPASWFEPDWFESFREVMATTEACRTRSSVLASPNPIIRSSSDVDSSRDPTSSGTAGLADRLARCLRACERGPAAVSAFCRTLGKFHPRVRQACRTVVLLSESETGKAACRGICWRYFSTGWRNP